MWFWSPIPLVAVVRVAAEGQRDRPQDGAVVDVLGDAWKDNRTHREDRGNITRLPQMRMFI